MSDCLAMALALAERGYSVIPCRGKVASVNWQPYQHRRAAPDEIEAWARAGVLENIAIVLGEVSGVFAMDLDGDEAVSAWHGFFGEARTVTVRSGSGHGHHVYFRPDGGMPKTTRVLHHRAGNIELRAAGCYVVAPPSVHPVTGKRYEIISRDYGVASLEPAGWGGIVDWIHSLQREKAAALYEQQRNMSSAAPVKRRTAWAGKALADECAAVRRAGEGGANNTLNRAAFKLGQLVAEGHISAQEVESALLAAADALTQRDGARASLKTIRSGLFAGINNPRAAK